MGVKITHTIKAGRSVPRGLLPDAVPASVRGSRFVTREDIVLTDAYACICKRNGITGGDELMTARITIWDSDQKRYVVGTDSQEFTPTNERTPAADAWVKSKEREPYASGVDVFEEGQVPPV